MAFFQPDELAALQDLALPFMTTPVKIFRPVVEGEGWTDPVPSGYVAEYDYGDDEFLDPDLEDPGTYPVVETTGWFYSHLQQNVADDSGQLGTIDIHEVRLPVGTDIQAHDLLEQVDTGEVYVVVDANTEDTVPDMVRAVLRRRE